MEFFKFNLSKNIMKGIDSIGFKESLPVQKETLIHSLKKKDVCVQAQTGTGKTAAFLISIFQLFEEERAEENKKALIIVPTRELAVQVDEEAKLIGKFLPYNSGSFYGGVSYKKQTDILKKNINIIIATPGRLLDLVQKRILSIADTSIIVIDEADRLLDMGFYPDLKRVLNHLMKTDRQTLLFSATLNDRTLRLAADFMKDPVQVNLSPDTITVDNITQYQYHVAKSEKINLLLGIFKKENPKNVLIFTNTKIEARRICKRFEFNNIPADYIIGDLPQTKRLSLINQFKSGKIRVLIATDVAARGLHINDLDLVINYDLPENCENYVHRIGRTARLGKEGKAITLTCEDFVYGLEAIEAYINMKIPVKSAEESMYLEDKSHGQRLFKPDNRKFRSTKPKPEYNKKNKVSGHYRSNKSTKAEYDNKKFTPAKSESDNKNFKSKRYHKRRNQKRPLIKFNKSSSQNERLEYYRKKYGEDFQVAVTETPLEKEKRKTSLFRRIINNLKK